MATTQRTQQFALKYRPRKLGEVIAQEAVVATLRGMIKNSITHNKRIPGTLLLAGPHSTGKTSSARLIAYYINCEQLTEDFEPCGVCESCKAMVGVVAGNGSHPDVTEIDAASQRGINDIRALKRMSELSPVTNYRVFILDECHQITKDAWEASLKSFEEPPASTIFILCTTAPEVLPKTILSRATRFMFQPIPIGKTSLLLKKVARKEGCPLPKKYRLQIAGIAEGHPREALNILESVVNHLKSSGKHINLEEAFPKILAQNDTYKSYIAAQDYMSAVLEGKYLPSFKALKGADNHTFFTTQIVNITRMLLEGFVDRSLIDRKAFWMTTKVKKIDQQVGRAHMKEYNQLLKIFLDAQGKIKTYLLDPFAVLESATIDAIQVIHGLAKQKSPRH